MNTLAAAVLCALLAGCAAPLPSSTPTASPKPASAPSATWWAVGGASACGRPAAYRLDGHLTYLGGCDGNLGYPPAEITVAVGHVFDLHMTAEVVGGSPLYPLPTTPDPSIIRLIAAQDAGTATFQAVAPGSAVLLTTGNCSGSGVSPAFVGPCPVVQVDVISP